MVFVLSPELKSELVVDPGEMIAIKTASCPDIKNKKVFFYVFNTIEYAIVPSPYTKDSKLINTYCIPIKVNKKNLVNQELQFQMFLKWI